MAAESRYDARAMPKSPSKPSRRRAARTSARGRAALPVADAFWSELLSTLRDLRAEVKRLADASEPQPPLPHLDWADFAESRKAAAEGRERYWRDMGSAAVAE